MNKQEITSKIKEITETGAVCGVDVYVCLKGEEQGFYIEKMISMNSLKDRIRSIALEIINTQYLQDEVVYENDIVLSRAEYVQLEKILTSGKENENAKNFILKRRKKLLIYGKIF